MKENEPIISMVHTMIENSALRPQLYQQVRSWTVNDAALPSAKSPSDPFWFILRVPHDISVSLISFFVYVSFGKMHFIHAFQDAAVSLAWLC